MAKERWQILRLYFSYLTPLKHPYLLYLALLGLSVICTDFLTPPIIRSLVDHLQTFADTRAINDTILIILGTLSLVTLMNAIFLFLADILIAKINPQIMTQIEDTCLTRLHSLSYQFLTDRHIGGLISKVKRFADGYDLVCLNLSRGLWVLSLKLGAAILITLLLAPTIALVFILWGILFLLVLTRLLSWKMKRDREFATAESIATGVLADSLSNFTTVKLHSGLSLERDYFLKVASDRAHALIRSWQATAVISLIQGVAFLLLQIIALSLALRSWHNHNLSTGTVVLVQTYIISVGSAMVELGNRLKAISRSVASAQEMADILDAPVDIKNPDTPLIVSDIDPTIELVNVTLRYSSSKSNLFDELSLTIPSGQRVGIVGHSGAGKSSLVRLLVRFVDVTNGAVHIGGVDIRKISQDELRKLVAVIPQDPQLFHRSLYDNITFGKGKVDESTLAEVLQDAQLEELIENLPHGINTIVGERGIKLSGGERQRVAVARALLRDTPILVLDEATSSVDSHTETALQRAFSHAMKGRTTLVIAHRLATVRALDRILVLERGKIVEDGTPEVLINGNGAFAALCRQQAIIG